MRKIAEMRDTDRLVDRFLIRKTQTEGVEASSRARGSRQEANGEPGMTESSVPTGPGVIDYGGSRKGMT